MITPNAPTVADLLALGRRLGRIDPADYRSHGAYRAEVNRRDRQRRAVKRAWPDSFADTAAALVPGAYGPSGRLRVTARGIEYVAGQYAPLEIWHAIAAYFSETAHGPRSHRFAVTVEMAAGFTRTLEIEAGSPEAAAAKVRGLAGIGAGDFIDSIRRL